MLRHLIIAIVLINILKAGSILAVKMGLRELPAFLSAGIRFTLAGLLLVVVASVLRARARSRGTEAAGRLVSWGLMILGVVVGTAYGLYYLSLKYTAVSRAGIIVNVNPLITAILAGIFLRERVSWHQIAGLLVAFAGVVLLESGAGGFADGVMLGDLLMLGSCLAWSSAAVLKKHLASYAEPTVITAWEVLPGGLALLAVSAVLEPWSTATWGPTALLSLGYLVLLGTGVAFVGYVWVLQRASATVVTGFSFVIPLTAVVLGVLVLDEPVGWRLAGAFALVVAGLSLLSLRRTPTDRSGPSPDIAP
ncbi:MAG: DMT family transporter [bacterium]